MAVLQNQVLEASARMEFDGVEDQVNVYQYQLITPTPVDEADAVDDILTILEDFYTIWLAAQSILIAFRDIRIRNVSTDTILGTFGWPSLTAGTAADDALPPGNAGLINLNTDIARVSPRKYMGGLTVGSMESDSKLVAATVTKLAAMGAFLLADQIETYGTWVYGYLSPKTSAFEVPVGANITDITAYQRRRKQGRGS